MGRVYKLDKDEYRHLLLYTEDTFRKLVRQRLGAEDAVEAANKLIDDEISRIIKEGRKRRRGRRKQENVNDSEKN